MSVEKNIPKMLFDPSEENLSRVDGLMSEATITVLLNQEICSDIIEKATWERRAIGFIGGAIGGSVVSGALGFLRKKEPRAWSDDVELAKGIFELGTIYGPLLISGGLGAVRPSYGINVGVLGTAIWLIAGYKELDKAMKPMREKIKRQKNKK